MTVERGVAHGVEQVEPGASVVTIGNFDGVHLGHQVLLRRTVDAATDRGLRAVAVTFDPHPAAVLRPGSEPPSLASLEERIERIQDAGTDLVLVLPFTDELAALTPEAFVERVLVTRLQAARVVVGANFRFGHKAAGDVVVLVETGEQHGFDVEAVAVRELDGDPISSSAIRSALAAGDVGWATRALGRPYRLRGEVVRGEGRGRRIGIPTANLAVAASQTVPANGVYAGHAEVAGTTWRCVTNVGVRPTFDGGGAVTVEPHLLDVEGDLDLYGRDLTVSFEHRIRGERRFDSVDELVAQIRADVGSARTWLTDAEQRPAS